VKINKEKGDDDDDESNGGSAEDAAYLTGKCKTLLIGALKIN
jgi:hypothetical protein